MRERELAKEKEMLERRRKSEIAYDKEMLEKRQIQERADRMKVE
jgi:hypothetical protein